MTDGQYVRYRERAEADYAASIAASGALPPPEARSKARDDYARLLPDGLRSEGHRLWTAYVGADEAGVLWLHLKQALGQPARLRLQLRGARGPAPAGLRPGDDAGGGAGVPGTRRGVGGLSVFGHNSGARALYEQMGFEVAAVQMRKRL